MSDAATAAGGWLDYWKADCAASCEPDNPATAREIAGLWQSWFAGFPDGTRILDIATGNGIVLAQAAAAARASGRRFELTGIDLADIDPPRYVRTLDPELRRARFLGRTAAEALPFADGCFDVVASQYGLEYADLERALHEAERVLAPGGALVWLAHSSDSEIVRQHRLQAAELDFLLAGDGPIALLGSFVGGAAEALDAAVGAAHDYAHAHAPAPIVREFVDGFAALIAHRGSNATTLAAPLAEATRRVRGHRARIASLLAAVLTPERLARVQTRLAAPPWTNLTTTEVRVGASRSPIGIHVNANLVSDT